MMQNNIANEFGQCNKCGLCLATCPVCKEILLEKYSPRGKIQLARFYSQGVLELSEQYREIFSRCLLCGSCTVTCPSGVHLSDVFVHMRHKISEGRGVHPKVDKAVKSLLANHNISGEENSERGEWRDFLKGLPSHTYEKDRADVIYFVGCVSSFFPLAQRIPQDLVKILDSAGVDFSILGGEEWCCGFPLIGAGVPEKIKETMEHNLERVRGLGAKAVVFSCPSCLRTWKEYYETDLQLFHDTQYIKRLVRDKAIRLGEVHETVTYHDPCDLGRNGGVFEAPREILRSIPGLTLVELESNRAKSICCGGGGNLEMVDPDLSSKVAQKKIRQIEQTGAKTVVTSCQQCVRTMTTFTRRNKVPIEVLDITQLVLKALQK